MEVVEELVHVTGLELLLARDGEAHLFVHFGRHNLFEAHLLEVQHHVGHIFDDAVDGSEFMGDAIDVDRSDSEAFK